jgi:hypothetical protein
MNNALPAARAVVGAACRTKAVLDPLPARLEEGILLWAYGSFVKQGDVIEAGLPGIRSTLDQLPCVANVHHIGKTLFGKKRASEWTPTSPFYEQPGLANSGGGGA